MSPVNRTAAVPAHLRHPSMSQQQQQQSSESPPPPPPPPVSTHPLVLGQQTGNPWEREEKEREVAMRRQEAARQWMEEQIDELESTANRTPKQEEQLRALKLEMEFRKRAMEAAEEEDVSLMIYYYN